MNYHQGKVYVTILLCLLFGSTAKAQEHVSFGPLHSLDSPREDWILPGDTIYQSGKPMIYQGKPLKNPDYQPAKPQEDGKEKEWNNRHSWLGGYGWGLHKGLNLSVDLSAFATFGKYAPHRGGFAQTIDATYLAPLTKDNKLWIAFGAYANHVNYGGDNFQDGGIYGILSYQINPHWETYIYGQLSITNNYNSLYGRYAGYGPYGYAPWGYGMYPWGMGYGIMPGGYGMGMPGANVLGAGIRYTNTKKTFSIGFNVEGVWYDSKVPSYYKQYDYPVPKAPGEMK